MLHNSFRFEPCIANLDGNDEIAAVLEEELRVERDDPGLVGLGHVGEDAVDHGDEHPVLVGVARIFDDGDHVGPFLGHVQKVATRPGEDYMER